MDKYRLLALERNLTQKDVKSLLTFINNLESKSQEQTELVKIWNDTLKDPLKLNEEYFTNAGRYLMKKHINKDGFIYPLTPFKTVKDIYVLSTLQEISIIEIKDFGTIFKRFYLPVFKAKGKQNHTFKYVIFKGQVEILKNKYNVEKKSKN